MILGILTGRVRAGKAQNGLGLGFGEPEPARFIGRAGLRVGPGWGWGDPNPGPAGLGAGWAGQCYGLGRAGFTGWRAGRDGSGSRVGGRVSKLELLIEGGINPYINVNVLCTLLMWDTCLTFYTYILQRIFVCLVIPPLNNSNV